MTLLTKSVELGGPSIDYEDKWTAAGWLPTLHSSTCVEEKAVSSPCSIAKHT